MSFAIHKLLLNVAGGFQSTKTLIYRHIKSKVTRLPIQRFSCIFQKRLNAEIICRKFDLSIDELKNVTCRMSNAIKQGLKSADSLSSVKCWNTYVDYPPTNLTIMPSFTARNHFLSLEFPYCDHDHFRMGMISRSDDNNNVRHVHQSDIYPLTKYFNECSNQELFIQLSNRLKVFSDEVIGTRASGVPLVVTIGFPIWQTALDTASLYRWTKEFHCENIIGQDFVSQFRSSLTCAGLDVGTIAVLNDTCALILNSLTDRQGAQVGLVVGNGCNCCYTELAANVQGCQPTSSSSDVAQTIVNTEWGALGENGELDDIKTVLDKSLDAQSRNPGKQIFEKMTSGLYMAELVRMIVLELATKKVLFGGTCTQAMSTPYILKPKHLSLVESDDRRSYKCGRAVLTKVLCVPDPAEFDCELFRYACECVTKRSAHLVSAGLVSVLSRIRRPASKPVVVAVGGSVLKSHPKYFTMVGCKAQHLADHVPFTLRSVNLHEHCDIFTPFCKKITHNQDKSSKPQS